MASQIQYYVALKKEQQGRIQFMLKTKHSDCYPLLTVTAVSQLAQLANQTGSLEHQGSVELEQAGATQLASMLNMLSKTIQKVVMSRTPSTKILTCCTFKLQILFIFHYQHIQLVCLITNRAEHIVCERKILPVCDCQAYVPPHCLWGVAMRRYVIWPGKRERQKKREAKEKEIIGIWREKTDISLGG